MKILFYINTIGHGGAERVMVNLASQFYKDDVETILVTSFPIENEYGYEHGIKRYNLTTERRGNFFSRNCLLIRTLRKVIKEEEPDIVISFMAEPNFRALLASRGLKCKTLISVRNDPNKEYGNFVFRLMAKTLYKRASGIVFQTEDAKAWFPKRIRQNSRIICNQVNRLFFETEVSRDTSDIVTAGRLVPQKNHEMLIRAFALIKDEIDANLIIYGEGDLRTKLEQLVSDLDLCNRVILAGNVSDINKKLAMAKLFVLSSDYEGMPNALMEAMAI